MAQRSPVQRTRTSFLIPDNAERQSIRKKIQRSPGQRTRASSLIPDNAEQQSIRNRIQRSPGQRTWASSLTPDNTEKQSIRYRIQRSPGQRTRTSSLIPDHAEQQSIRNKVQDYAESFKQKQQNNLVNSRIKQCSASLKKCCLSFCQFLQRLYVAQLRNRKLVDLIAVMINYCYYYYILCSGLRIVIILTRVFLHKREILIKRQ